MIKKVIHRLKNGKNYLKNYWENHKKLVIITAIILVLLFLSVFGAKIALYLNFLLGNDVYLQLSADKEILPLTRGMTEKVTFTASVTTNPFCQANCAAVWEELSQNLTLDQNIFSLQTGLPFKKEYELKTEKLGRGQEYYRLKMNCQSEKSFFCHTSQQPISKSILIVVNYDLSQEEKQLQQELKTKLEEAGKTIYEIEQQKLLWSTFSEEIKNRNMVEPELFAALENLEPKFLREQFQNTEKIWLTENYSLLQQEMQGLSSSLQAKQEQMKKIELSVINLSKRYNNLILQIEQEKELQVNLQNTFFTQEDFLDALNNLTTDFNLAGKIFLENNSLMEKETVFSAVSEKLLLFNSTFQEENKKEALRRAEELEQRTRKLCQLGGTCGELNVSEFNNLGAVCDAIISYQNTLREFIFQKFNSSLNNSNIYLINHSLILENCPVLKMEFISLFNFSAQEIILLELVYSSSINFTLSLPAPHCQLFTEEKDCCDTIECQDSPENYPIIFLHGHAFNKDVSAEYSLDAFTKIQQKLEEDDYLNLGALSDYTITGDSENNWQEIPVPLTLKTSYYFDVFKEPQSYIQVQTKSESIDAYAIKLKENIDYILQKTGRQKVIIIAHSMGGLVARRYLQVFGSEKVDRLIMIGTPNKGIIGNVADYCPLKGEQLECRDLNSGSLFMNKLNREGLSDIPIFNIVGSGCEMEDQQGASKQGDGIVLVENVEMVESSNSELENVKNYIIKGDCEGSNLLHTDLLDIEKYPKVYKRIREALRK